MRIEKFGGCDKSPCRCIISASCISLVFVLIGCRLQIPALRYAGATELDTLSFIPVKSGKSLVLNRDYDLMGKEIILPDNVTLIAQKGVIKNGTLIGKNTRIQGEKAMFDHVTIRGTWIVPNITTTLFRNLSYDNSLTDVFALSSPNIKNSIIIENGDYYVSTTSYGFALTIPSNTEVVIEGRIHLRPNDFRGYSVLGMSKSSNIVVRGSGLVEGDRLGHTGTSGEWGHGINILECENVTVSGIKVSNCWGDCVYIGNNSENVTVKNCVLTKGRRQGVSITSGNQITISNCLIKDISGTSPQYAIDIEPNENESVDNILIENIKAINCFGGYKSWGGTQGAYIGSVIIRNCSLESSSSNYPVKFVIGKKIVIENCDFKTGIYPGIVISVVDEVVVRNNVVRTLNNRTIAVDRAKKETIEKNTVIK